jgi:hypothetical protein
VVAGILDPVNVLVQDTLNCCKRAGSPCLVGETFFASESEKNLVWVVWVYRYGLCLLMGMGVRKGAVLDLGVGPVTVLV